MAPGELNITVEGDTSKAGETLIFTLRQIGVCGITLYRPFIPTQALFYSGHFLA